MTTFEQMKAAVEAATLGAWSVHTDRRGLETILCDDPNDGDCCWEIAKMPPGEANAAAIVAALNWLRGGGIAQVEAMREALGATRDRLDDAAQWFDGYAESHRDKGALEKAERNQVRRDMCHVAANQARAALAATEEAK